MVIDIWGYCDMGGRGSYSVRKAFSGKDIIKGTKVAKEKAAAGAGAEAADRGLNFGGGNDSGRQTVASMDAEFSGWRASLNADQVMAFARYTNGYYKDINDALRHNKYGNSEMLVKAATANFKSSFNHTLSKDITVYRGTGTSDAARLKEMTTVGTVFRDKGAFSTSISKSFAKNWASSKTNAVLYTVRLPKGYKGAAWVQSISPHKSEKEVLIRPGQNWKIVKQLKSTKGGMPHYLITPV